MEQQISVKIVIVGDGAVGKTCVMVRYAEGFFDMEYTPTVFDSKTKQVDVSGRKVNLGMWDTAGQEEYSRLRPIAYPNTDVFLVAFSVVEPNSFVNAKKKWYPQVKGEVPGSMILFVGTKADLRDSGTIIGGLRLSTAEIQKNLRQQFDCNYLECSAMTGQGIDMIFLIAARMVMIKRGILRQKRSDVHTKSRTITQDSGIFLKGNRQKPNTEDSRCHCVLI